MSVSNNLFPLIVKKIVNSEASFGWEIAAALLLKFLLLGGLWWVFFAGTQQPVNEAIIAGKFFGEPQQAIISQKSQRDINDHP